MDFVSSVQVHFEWTFEPGDEDRVSETIFHNLLNIPNQYPSIQIKITILINAEESASTFCCFHLSNTSFWVLEAVPMIIFKVERSWKI